MARIGTIIKIKPEIEGWFVASNLNETEAEPSFVAKTERYLIKVRHNYLKGEVIERLSPIWKIILAPYERGKLAFNFKKEKLLGGEYTELDCRELSNLEKRLGRLNTKRKLLSEVPKDLFLEPSKTSFFLPILRKMSFPHISLLPVSLMNLGEDGTWFRDVSPFVPRLSFGESGKNGSVSFRINFISLARETGGKHQIKLQFDKRAWKNFYTRFLKILEQRLRGEEVKRNSLELRAEAEVDLISTGVLVLSTDGQVLLLLYRAEENFKQESWWEETELSETFEGVFHCQEETSLERVKTLENLKDSERAGLGRLAKSATSHVKILSSHLDIKLAIRGREESPLEKASIYRGEGGVHCQMIRGFLDGYGTSRAKREMKRHEVEVCQLLESFKVKKALVLERIIRNIRLEKFKGGFGETDWLPSGFSRGVYLARELRFLGEGVISLLLLNKIGET